MPGSTGGASAAARSASSAALMSGRHRDRQHEQLSYQRRIPSSNDGQPRGRRRGWGRRGRRVRLGGTRRRLLFEGAPTPSATEGRRCDPRIRRCVHRPLRGRRPRSSRTRDPGRTRGGNRSSTTRAQWTTIVARPVGASIRTRAAVILAVAAAGRGSVHRTHTTDRRTASDGPRWAIVCDSMRHFVRGRPPRPGPARPGPAPRSRHQMRHP